VPFIALKTVPNILLIHIQFVFLPDTKSGEVFGRQLSGS